MKKKCDLNARFLKNSFATFKFGTPRLTVFSWKPLENKGAAMENLEL